MVKRFQIQQGNLFFFLITSEFIGAVANVRLELMIVGAMAWSVELILRRRTFVSAFTLAIPCVLKYQALAFGGLWAIKCFVRKNERPWVFAFLFSTLLLFLSAMLPLGFHAYLDLLASMKSHVAISISEQFSSMLHLNRFLSTFFKIPLNLEVFQAVSMIVALAMALWVFKARRASQQYLLFLTLGLSSIFMLSFSPLSQSASYVLIAPFFLFCFVQWRHRLSQVGIIGAWIMMSVLYSDLVPKEFRQDVFFSGIKSLAPLWLFAFTLQPFRLLKSQEKV